MAKHSRGCIFQAHEKRVPCQSCLLIEMSYFLAAISLLALFLAYIVIFSHAKAPLLLNLFFEKTSYFRTPSS